MPPSPIDLAAADPLEVNATIEVARAQWGQGAWDQALATLTAALEAEPLQAPLWLTLAQLLCAQAQHAQAIVFFEEALRLDPTLASAMDGLADALLLGGDEERALEASAQALASGPDQRRLAAHGLRLLAAGRLEAGWAAFAGAFAGEGGEAEIRVAAPPWTPGAPLAGRLLVFGEADVAREILLAQALPDLIARAPPLVLAVDARWLALARRSFAGVVVVARLMRDEGGRRLQAADLDGPQWHGAELVGAWTALRTRLPELRAGRAAFGGARPYLAPAPQRVAYWRQKLATLGPGPKIGVLWRTPSGEPDRAWEAPPLSALAVALSRPDLRLIGLQGEAVLGELAWVRQTFGLPIRDPPADLETSNLDDVAALTLALDVVIGAPDTASYLAAASGAATWFLAPPRHWALLGGANYPWFETARVFCAEAPGDWRRALDELKQALGELPAARPPPSWET